MESDQNQRTDFGHARRNEHGDDENVNYKCENPKNLFKIIPV